jgi:uracil-DNA glycosylase
MEKCTSKLTVDFGFGLPINILLEDTETPDCKILQKSLNAGLGSWTPFFENISSNIISKLDAFLEIEYRTKNVYPEPSKIFNALILTPLNKIKVVIIGQDPYHTKNVATGLAFGHSPENKKIQPSLKNIHKELESCGYKVNNKSGDLVRWATQGVLLINTALTVIEGKPNSHSNEWKLFTTELLKFVSKNVDHAVIILWGNYAQKYENMFDPTKHKFIKSAHPSPLSATNGFFGSEPFLKCNKFLTEWGIDVVDWNLA